MRITTEKQVNVLVWAIVITLLGCAIANFLTNVEVISATVGLVFIGSVCLLEVVHRSEPGQQVLSHLPKVLPDNRFLRWILLLAGGIVTVDWILEIGEFLLAG
ncbi:hypothetical protein F4009_05895 [Candidatus Poribacteria bacterium]|nr:hypothetical protein [Candidatus Poribacteria bacterium]MYH81341.1 hypothetical protein [Candidatus Poribacteria bacterium]MYK93521.1 hypothetical protein [Candidatus Poribacteria bacterium]